MDPNQRKDIIEIWKSVVAVQQHFNDIEMRIRSMFVTILLALFASIGFLLDKNPSFDVCGWKIGFVVLIPIFGVIGSFLFYFIDRYWYHRLLVGSVKHAMKIEKTYATEIPELSLSDAIGAESPYQPRFPITVLAKLLVTDDKYQKTGKLHSDGKIELFYKPVILLLVVIFLIISVFGGISPASPNAVVPQPQTTPNTTAG